MNFFEGRCKMKLYIQLNTCTITAAYNWTFESLFLLVYDCTVSVECFGINRFIIGSSQTGIVVLK
jgi:hypothetical protein